jgi:lipopolysaccharide biosynthesis glycosyltransferase
MPPVIVSATDERFVRHFAAMLHSVWTHHPDARVYLLDCGIKPATLAMLTDWAGALGVRLIVIEIDIARFTDLPTNRDWTAAIYARLLIPDLLPPDTERTLYIDADCIVMADLSPLWQMDIGDAAIAGVRDRGGWHEGLTGNARRDYVNSGVMLMNLSVWRRDRLAASIADMIADNGHFCCPDQTAINLVCDGHKVFLPNCWNLTLGDPPLRLQGGALRILHWTGFMKPWLYRDARFGAAYLHHRKQTPFTMVPPARVHRSWKRRLIALLAGRPKYWRPFILALRCQSLVDDYLASRKSVLRRGALQVSEDLQVCRER